MNTRIVIPLSILALFTATSAANATGYFVVAEAQADGSKVIGWQGSSTTPIVFQTTDFTNFPSAALYDFNGNGIPDVVVTSNFGPTGIEIFPDFGAGTPIFMPFDSAHQGIRGGAISITPPTITVADSAQPSTLLTFTYSPGGTPSLPSPVFDLNGDGIADSVATGSNNVYVTDGATNQTTTITAFSEQPDYIQIITWSPVQAPEPASLSLLALACPLLLKRRR